MRVLLVAACVALAAPLSAQRGGRFPDPSGFRGAFGCVDPPVHNIPYDGKFTFARIIYSGGPGNCYYRGEPSWAHGYGYTQNGPAEQNLLKITGNVSSLRPHVEATNAIAIDDPALRKYPVAFMVEATYVTLNDKEVKALRDYIKRGGFLILDDFRDDYRRGQQGWTQFESWLGRVLPGLTPIDVPITHPIFHSFFDIQSFDIVPQNYDQGRPAFKGVFEGNDPSKRLLMMINFNTDVSNYWEFSAQGFMPVSESNEAYKIGVNYVMYALSHY